MSHNRKKYYDDYSDPEQTALELELDDDKKIQNALYREQQSAYRLDRDESRFTLFFVRSESQRAKLIKKRHKELDKIEGKANYQYAQSRSESNKFKLPFETSTAGTPTLEDYNKKTKSGKSYKKL